jgi:hypothetical protein
MESTAVLEMISLMNCFIFASQCNMCLLTSNNELDLAASREGYLAVMMTLMMQVEQSARGCWLE